MTTDPVRKRAPALRWVLAPAVLAPLCAFLALTLAGGDLDRLGEIELRVKSDYSNIRVRKLGSVRSLTFIRDSGEEVVESQVDLKKPYDLLITYTRYMFTSYLFRPRQERVLIVGLGGGSMVHFLKHHDPAVKVDVVEIDPAVVKIADKYFGVRGGGNVRIFNKDAFEYLKKTPERYDVIYMDAFLKPSRDTDSTGVPLRLKTIRFYKDLQKKLKPGGLVAFNVNPHEGVGEDLANIREAFPQAYVFSMPEREGLVVVGSTSSGRMESADLLAAGAALDRRFGATFSFRDMAARLVR
jgi:spermidine synthase